MNDQIQEIWTLKCGSRTLKFFVKKTKILEKKINCDFSKKFTFGAFKRTFLEHKKKRLRTKINILI